MSFTLDDEGDWVAHLDCLHRQHVRHSPPFRTAVWVLDETERNARIGTALDCPLCDRAELPEDLEHVRITETWTDVTLPRALRREHRVASGVWGLLHIREGAFRFRAATTPPIDRVVTAGQRQAIPPDVAHALEPAGPGACRVEFLRRRDTLAPTAPDSSGDG